MRAIITGATGFIGKRLVASVGEPVVLSRDPARARENLGVEARFWDAETGKGTTLKQAFRGAEAVFHLAGEPVAEGRWTGAKKARIRESRVAGTRHLVAAIAQLPASERPRVLVSASAVGIYGSRGDEILDERSKPGEGFLVDVCKAWEAEAARARDLGVRVVTVRIGIVLGRDGGALGQLLPLFRLGLGGRVTLAGAQWMPWIHVDDLVGILLHAARTESVPGVLNGVAPNPVRNRDFTRALASALGRPALFPVPALALRVGVGEFATVLTASQRVIPRAVETSAYRYAYPDLESALRAIVRPPEPVAAGAPA